MAAVTVLETRGLTRQFGGVVAVDNVDFELPQGQIRGIIGPNGAGKTTLVSLIAGRIGADGGQIRLMGHDISRTPAHKRVRRGIVYTFQVSSTFAQSTVLENVALASQSRLMQSWRSLISVDEQKVHSIAFDALQTVGLAEVAHEIVAKLPYGHQRLVEVAMSWALNPKLLILDEPTQGLSEGEIDNLTQVLATKPDAMTVLIIEHNMPFVLGLAETVTVMDGGAVLFEGTPAAVSANQAVQDAYLG